MAQSVERRSHNPKVASSILARRDPLFIRSEHSQNNGSLLSSISSRVVFVGLVNVDKPTTLQHLVLVPSNTMHSPNRTHFKIMEADRSQYIARFLKKFHHDQIRSETLLFKF